MLVSTRERSNKLILKKNIKKIVGSSELERTTAADFFKEKEATLFGLNIVN